MESIPYKKENLETKKFNKFVNLSFNLKNEIFYFLPFSQQMTEIFILNKRFIYAINNNILAKIFIKEDPDNLKESIINPYHGTIKSIQNKIENNLKNIQIDYLQKEIINDQICFFSFNLLSKKDKNSTLHINVNMLSIKYFDFYFELLKTNKNYETILLNYIHLGRYPKIIAHLVEALKINNTIKELNLSKCSLFEKSESLPLLAKGLNSNK